MSHEKGQSQHPGLAVDAAFRAGDLAALRAALGEPADFPNTRMAMELGLGDHPLAYAIYRSPLGFIETLLDLGAEPNYAHDDGFPSLIAALSAGRLDVLRLLLDRGADVRQRGLNDWTPLHTAVNQRDLAAVRLLLAHGADPALPTRIDDCTTALQDAEAAGFTEAVALLRRQATGQSS